MELKAAEGIKSNEAWKELQAKYGEKPHKEREIKKQLGKDDFMRIMVTQMRHQDPTQPFKAEQFASEMAQYASVEQLSNMNQNLNKMAEKNQPTERLAMTHLIGKKVVVDRDRFQHEKSARETLSFVLPEGGAETVKVSLLSESGETVFQKDLGAQKEGKVSFDWDGRTGATEAKKGQYLIKVDAKSENGKTVKTGSIVESQVIGVSFEGSEPQFLIGDAKHSEKIPFRQIIRIEEEGKTK